MAIAIEGSPGNGFLPGTTSPESFKADALQPMLANEPFSTPGPTIHNRPTTITLFEPAQLANTPFVPLLRPVVNRAFSLAHGATKSLPEKGERLKTPEQFLNELGTAPGTFAYVIHRDEPLEVLASVSSKRWLGKPDFAGHDPEQTQALKRSGQPRADVEEWELTMMVVVPELQRQGLAGLMMKLVEDEIRRRHASGLYATSGVNGESKLGKPLMLILTTIKEVNEVFYAKRGFVKEYEKFWPPGHLESEHGFTILAMSKML